MVQPRVALFGLVALTGLHPTLSALWDQHTDLTSEILKNGPLQGGFNNGQRPTNMMMDASVVRFEPRSLQLLEQHTCVPHWESVEIVNIGDKDITVEAASSDHNMFHPSLSKPETLQRHESMKVQVLFLAQSVGQFEGLVFIQTNLGMIPYTVKATAVENPYKVEPIVGAKVVVGERFSPPVSIYNPHSTNLHVREVFTTEGYLHLALPDRLGDGATTGQALEREAEAVAGTESASSAAGVWTVQPKQHKTVIHVNFIAHITGKFQGFVHLKTDIDNLLVPVEIMVTKGGVHVTPEVVDFQTLVSPLQSRSMWLTLTNLNPQPIELLSLYDPKQDPNLQITGFDQKGVDVVPGGTVRFAKVTYHGGEEGFMQGKLQLIINDTDSVSATLDIPYKARVLYGSLGFMNDKTKFQSTPGKVTSTMRSIMISNNFSVPILIHTAKIDDPSFTISHFTPNSLLQPGDAVSLMHVEFTSNGTSALYTRDLELSTNVTAMKIPLQVYHGKLHCQTELGGLKECSSSDLNLGMGTISVSESRRKFINLTNHNPVNVTIESITFTHATVNLYMQGVWGPKGEQVREARPVPRNLQSKRVLTLPPGHRLALAIEVVATDAGVTSAAVTISTRRKENIVFLVRYESVLGNLAFLPTSIRFEASFPGRVQSRTVAARSTFERPLHITAVRSTDSRIIPELITRSLNPLARTEIARVHYDPSKSTSADEAHMPQSDEVEWDVPLTEEIVERWTSRQRVWEEFGAKGQAEIEATLLFDTNIIRGASLTIRAFLTKPTIVRESTLSFDLTQVGTSVTQMLIVHNPSDTILAVQLVFPLCDLITEANSTCDVGFKLAAPAQQVFHVNPHSDLPVGPIVFEPLQHTAFNTTLYVRNNLTMLHQITLNGIGGSGRLIFPNGALDFNLTADDLVEEAVNDDRAPRQRIAISKSFVATNDCELPVEVIRMDINGIPGCAGFGFEVKDCHPFTVAPHESVDLVVSFTPDFAASRWEQRLHLHTQSGILTVPLRAFVPAELLPMLADRAPFLGESEASLKKIITIISIVLCAVMFIVVVADSMKIYRSSTSCGRKDACQESGKSCEMISLLSWSGVNALAPSSMWGSQARRDHVLGPARQARRQMREEAAAAAQQAQQRAAAEAQEPPPQHEKKAGGRPGTSAQQQGGSGGGKGGAASDRATEVRHDREEDHHHKGGQQQHGEPSKPPLSSPRPGPKEEAKMRAVEDSERRVCAEVARVAAEELEKRMRDEERRKAREAAEDTERQVKAATEELRKQVEERRRAAEHEAQSSATAQAQAPPPAAPKADASKGKKSRGERKDAAEKPASAQHRESGRREPQQAASVPAPAEARPKAREEREKLAREERERERLAREERERLAREERERIAREKRERHAREERERLLHEEREKEERERTMREERERPPREERERHEDRELQARDDREKGREKRGFPAGAPQEPPAPSPKRKEPPYARRKEAAPPAAPPKPPGRPKESPAQHRPAAASTTSGPGPGLLQGSVWADPKPSFLPQSHWVAGGGGSGGAQKNHGGGASSAAGSASECSSVSGAVSDSAGGAGPGAGKLSLPPPPSHAPPPAPRRPGGGGGQPKASEAASKQQQYHSKQAAAAAAAGHAGGHQRNPKNIMVDVPPRRGGHGGAGQTHGHGAAVPAAAAAATGDGTGEQMPRPGTLDRGNAPLMAPIGPGPTLSSNMNRPISSLLPDQEFVPINLDSPSLDRMQQFGVPSFASSFFSAPFSFGFDPLIENPSGGPSGSDLLADLHEDSQPFETAASGRC